MLLLEGYRSGEREVGVRAPELHVAVRDADARQVWLRPFVAEPRSASSSADRARALLERLACDGLIRPLDAGWSEDRPVLVLECVSGVPADVYARGPAASCDQILALAVQLARTLERLHSAGMLVGEIAPDQVWIDAAAGRARIIDLSGARHIGEREPTGPANREFSLLAPEQSALLSWEVSVRSDLYSLGALLYLLASGRAPCGSGDGADVIRGHVAGTPAPLHALRPALPVALSRIVARLLEKDPDKRYQSARGLELDLLECQEQLARDGAIAPDLALGTGEPALPARRRARTQASHPAFQELQEGLERARRGGREWLIATRPPGGAAPAAALASGPGAASICFAAGSFAPCEGDVPYAGLRRVVTRIVRQLQLEAGERLDSVRDGLASLGELHAALTDWAPELAALCPLEAGASLARLRGPRALRRIALGLARLAQELARPERPLVLALDDLERGDLQGIELVAEMLIQSEADGLLVVSACGEASGVIGAGIEAAAERVARSGARVQRVALVPESSPDAADPGALPEPVRRLLAIASVLGLRFELSSLARLVQSESERVLGELAPALEHGVLEVCSEGLRFCDARTFEWACAQLPQEAAARMHGAAADQLEDADPDRTLFTRVRLLAASASELDDTGRSRLVGLCVAAVHRALWLGAAAHAARLARRGIEVVPEGEAPAELELLAVESEWLDGRGEQALEHLAAGAARHSSELARARSLTLSLEITAALQGSDAALALGMRQLRGLGVRAPERPKLADVRKSLQRTERALRTSRADVLSERSGDDPKQQARLVALSALLPMAAGARPLLAAWIAAEAILCMLKSGTSESPAPFMGAYALAQASLCANYEEGARRAALALKLESLWPDSVLRLRLELDMYLLALPWVMHRRKAIEPLRRVAREAEQMGDLDRAAFATWGAECFALLIAEPLPNVERRLVEIAERLARHGHPLAGTCRQAAQILHVLSVPEGNDVRPAPSELESEPALVRGFGALCSALVAYLAGRFERALEAATDVEGDDGLCDVLPFASERLLLRGLASAALAPGTSRGEQRGHVRTVRRSAERLRALAEAGPENFEHQALLMEAELARIENLGPRALALYARAGDRAEAQGYRHHAAIAHERRAMTALSLGLMSDGARFVHEAIVQLEEWGARIVADRLIEAHAELLAAYAPLPTRSKEATVRVGRTTTTTVTTTGRTETKTLDLATVLRSSEAISGEVELDRVIERVMAIAIENAGAQRAVLLLDRNGELRVEAEGAVGSSSSRRDQVALEEAGDIVPVNLVQYVQRTRRSVVLRDASSEGLFVEDPYVTANFVRSVLCVPILRQGRLVGVLYLENGLVTDAFTEGRVEVLRMLSSHAAISLDNARLYTELTELNRDLEARIEERTENLREARDAAEAATQAKSEFLAVMSHEIRTPMNVVIGMAQIMMDTDLSSDQRDCVRAIHTAGDSLLNVINDILDFSKIEAGKLELEVAPFSLRRCIEDVVEILAPRAHKKGLEFPIFVQRGVPEALLGDPNRLKQVVINFVNNAIKFTEHGSIEIQIQVASVDAERARLRFEVRDTGIGIPKSRIDRLFQSFSQVDASTTRKYGGTGLGLVISKRLIEAMKGEVGVDSVEGEGSTFWFEAAFERGAEEPQAPLGAARAIVLNRHPRSAQGLVEKIAALGVDAAAVEAPALALERIAAEQAAGRPYTALFLRYPVEDPAWDADVARLLAIPGLHVFPLCTLQERSGVERELPEGYARLLARPVKRDHLRSALALSIGIELDEQRPQGRGVSAEALSARSRYRILVAEDYALNRKLALRMLTRAGYTCEVVDDGRKVLEAVEREHWDLILMDCQMPEVDGFTATRQIRSREAIHGGHLPIVAMTANAMKGDRERCLQAGMDDYLSKPIQVEALYALLTHYLPDSLGPPSPEATPGA